MSSSRPLRKKDTALIERYENTKGLGLGGRSMTRALGLALLVLLGSISVLVVRLRGWPSLHLQWSAGDFQVFYQAALDTARGRDPYVRPAYHSIPAFSAFVRLFTLLPRPQAYAIWVSVLAAAQGLGMLLLATRHGYRAVLALLALSPAVLLTLLVGQPVPLLVLGLAAALYAVEHDRPVLAGACLAIVWVKPQIALPAAVFFALCRPRMALGFLLASAALLAPSSLPAWLHNITHFVAQSQNVQESPAGLWPQFLSAHVDVAPTHLVRRGALQPPVRSGPPGHTGGGSWPAPPRRPARLLARDGAELLQPIDCSSRCAAADAARTAAGRGDPDQRRARRWRGWHDPLARRMAAAHHQPGPRVTFTISRQGIHRSRFLTPAGSRHVVRAPVPLPAWAIAAGPPGQ